MPTDFASGSAPAAPTAFFSGDALLDAEKLDCYRLAVDFQALAARLLPKRGQSNLRDQLDRASVSIVLNICSQHRRGFGPVLARRQEEGLLRQEEGLLRPKKKVCSDRASGDAVSRRGRQASVGAKLV